MNNKPSPACRVRIALDHLQSTSHHVEGGSLFRSWACAHAECRPSRGLVRNGDGTVTSREWSR